MKSLLTLLLLATSLPAPEPPSLWLIATQGDSNGGRLTVFNSNVHTIWFSLELNTGNGWFTATSQLPAEPGKHQPVFIGFGQQAPTFWQVRAKEISSNNP